jgi:hypothetical protein
MSKLALPISLALMLVAATALAQSGERRAPLAGAEDLEPAVDVSPSRVAILDRSRQPVPPVAQAPAAVEPAAPPGPAAPPAVTPPQQTPPPAPRASSPRTLDSIDLGTTSITGNQELPKVLYIVPWKKSDLGDLVGRPVNTLLDEVLTPIDPEVFGRHLSYYETLYGKSAEE